MIFNLSTFHLSSITLTLVSLKTISKNHSMVNLLTFMYANIKRIEQKASEVLNQILNYYYYEVQKLYYQLSFKMFVSLCSKLLNSFTDSPLLRQF